MQVSRCPYRTLYPFHVGLGGLLRFPDTSKVIEEDKRLLSASRGLATRVQGRSVGLRRSHCPLFGRLEVLYCYYEPTIFLLRVHRLSPYASLFTSNSPFVLLTVSFRLLVSQATG